MSELEVIAALTGLCASIYMIVGIVKRCKTPCFELETNENEIVKVDIFQKLSARKSRKKENEDNEENVDNLQNV